MLYDILHAILVYTVCFFGVLIILAGILTVIGLGILGSKALDE